MSIRGGPDIIEDGLVLHLDAAEPLCFRGEPTTNLISSEGLNMSVLSTYTYLSRSQVAEPLSESGYACEMTIDNAGINGAARIQFGNATNIPTSGSTFISVWVKFHDGPTSNITPTVYAGSQWATLLPLDGGSQYLTSEYRRFGAYVSMGTASGGPNPGFSMTLNNDNRQVGQKTRWHSPQVEQKSYVTPFVSGTRGSTVATGGGLLDLTNNGNNGTITRAASPSASFYNTSNGGSFVFDGSNDCVLTPYTLNGSSTFTVSCWFKLDTVTKDWQSVVDAYKNPTDRNFQMWVSNQSKLYIWHLGSPSNAYSDQTLSANTWYNAVFTYGGSGNGILYLNSTITNNSVAKGSNTGGDISLNIGRRADGHANGYTQGTIPIVQAYNRQLSSAEILQNYNATKGRFGL